MIYKELITTHYFRKVKNTQLHYCKLLTPRGTAKAMNFVGLMDVVDK